MTTIGTGRDGKTTCLICGETHLSLRYRLPGFVVISCNGCGALFTTLRPGRAELEAMYAEEYFRSRQRYYLENPVFRPGAQPDQNTVAFAELLDRLDRHRGSGRLLDVGCGMGVFLAMARARGWDVRGVEISDFAARQAREHLDLPVFTGVLREATFPDASFDVVTLLDVFEHLPDPRGELEELFRVLRPGGTLLLDTPNADAFLRRLADRIYRWSGGTFAYPVRKLCHVYHLFYYSEAVLLRLLGEAGFHVDGVEGKVIPLPKARGNAFEKWIVKGLSLIEGWPKGPFELLVTARRPATADGE